MLEGCGIAGGLVLVGSVASAVYDLRYRLIPNQLTYSLLLAGALMSLIDGRAYQSLLALGLCVVLIFPLYVAGFLGGGDLKLLAGVSLFGDWQDILQCLAITLILGTAIAFTCLIQGMLAEVRLGTGGRDLATGEKMAARTTRRTIPLAVPIAGAVFCTHVLGTRLLA